MKFTKKQKKEIINQFFGAESSPGICKSCGYFGGRVEQDATNYTCPKCKKNTFDAACSYLVLSMEELNKLMK